MDKKFAISVALTSGVIVITVALFVVVVIAMNVTPFDYSTSEPISTAPQQQEVVHPGEKIFKANCATCHVPPLFTEPGWNLHTPAEIGIDDFQANRAPATAPRRLDGGGEPYPTSAGPACLSRREAPSTFPRKRIVPQPLKTASSR